MPEYPKVILKGQQKFKFAQEDPWAKLFREAYENIMLFESTKILTTTTMVLDNKL